MWRRIPDKVKASAMMNSLLCGYAYCFLLPTWVLFIWVDLFHMSDSPSSCFDFLVQLNIQVACASLHIIQVPGV
jgi:hypothetical protein